MSNYNFAPLSCWQPLNSGMDQFHSSNPTDISMMVGSNMNNYLGDGFDDNSTDQACYGSIDVQSQFPYFPTATHSNLMSTTTENFGIEAPPSLVDYQWSLPCETTKIDALYHPQSCKPTIKDVRKSVHGARLGQRNGGLSNLTSLEASRASKKRKAIEQLIQAQKLKASGRKSQKLSDKITALQEIVCPYGKTDTASVLQEACFYIKTFHQEIRRLNTSYFDGLSLQARLQLQGDVEKQSDLQSRGLCLVPVSIMKRLTRESEQHQTALRNNWKTRNY